MKISANAGEFGGALALAAFAIEARTNIPILSTVHITAHGDTVDFTATNLEITITVTMPAAIEQEGMAAVAGDPLCNLVNGFPAGETVSLTLNDTALAAHCDRARYRLPTWPVANWPEPLAIRDGDEIGRIELEREDVLHLLECPIFCAPGDRDKGRHYLHGAFLHHPHDNLLASVVTDGKRLAQATVRCNGKPLGDDAERSLIAPTATVKAAAEIIRRAKPESVALRRSTRLVEFSAPSFRLASRLIGSHYVGFECLIPPMRLPNTATVARTALIHALDRLDAVAGGKSHPIAMIDWTTGAGDIKLSLPRQRDAALEPISAETTGTARVGVSLDALVEIVNELRGERLMFEVNGKGAVRITVPGNDNVMVLQMPWRIDELEGAEE